MPSRPTDPDCPGYAPGPGDPLDPAYLRGRIREAPHDARRWLQLGDRLLDLCDNRRARGALAEAVRLDPANGLAHRLLALAMSRCNWPWAEILAVAVRATELRPADAEAWGLVAWPAYHAGQLERALEAWLRVAQLAPDAETYWNLGSCLDELGRSREALVALDEAVRLKRNHLPALRLRYLTARKLGDQDTARESLAALFGWNPVRARELMEGYRTNEPTPANGVKVGGHVREGEL